MNPIVVTMSSLPLSPIASTVSPALALGEPLAVISQALAVIAMILATGVPVGLMLRSLRETTARTGRPAARRQDRPVHTPLRPALATR